MDIKKINGRMIGLALMIFVAAIALDLFTKRWAAEILAKNPWSPISWFELTYSQNAGIAFGLPLTGWPLLILTGILIAGFAIYAVAALDLRHPSVTISASLILAGALGNFFDRLALGFVRDFIRIGVWPLFNLADSSIVLGFALLIYLHYSGKTHAS